jgi:GntR family transcriptional regulator/MocR family aminotransferase
MPTSPIVLDRAARQPLQLQIAQRLRAAIAGGVLAPGARLPSVRALAAQLGVARGTVDAGYAILIGEGMVLPRGAAGSIVSPVLASRPVPPVPAPDRAAAPPDLLARPLPFRLGLPALDAFPRKLWTGLTVHAARGVGTEALGQTAPAGLPELRTAIAGYLGVARGIVCTAEQVLVTAGFQGALALVRQVLLQRGEAVWIEDPGYHHTRHALAAAGARLVPVPVDREGLDVAAGMAAAPQARLAVVTPTHQSPLGVALSLARRVALLAWAEQADAWILEDDYDSEFRYTGPPLPALKSLDRAGRVLYGGSFSKVLFPALRLGYLVVPEPLAAAFIGAIRLNSYGLPSLEQRVVAAFMQQGHFARHLRRMRTLYAARRRALTAALYEAFGARIVVELAAGGMHLLARFPGTADDAILARRAVAAGLAPVALSELSIAGDRRRGLLIGFTNVPEGEAAVLAQRLAAALAE